MLVTKQTMKYKSYTRKSSQQNLGEGNVALKAAPNPFLCTFNLNKICLNQSDGSETNDKG